MKKIDNKALTTAIQTLDIGNSFQDIEDDQARDLYVKYMALKEHPELFPKLSEVDIFYNQYHYFVSYSFHIQKKNGYDAGLKQQEFKILDDANELKNIDWQIVEQISKQMKKEGKASVIKKGKKNLQDLFDRIAKNRNYKLFHEGIVKGDIKKILLGDPPYSLATKFDSQNQIPQMVIYYLHVLCINEKVSEHILEDGLNDIKIDNNNISLILAYLLSVRTYKEEFDLLKFNVEANLEIITEELDISKLPQHQQGIIQELSTKIKPELC